MKKKEETSLQKVWIVIGMLVVSIPSVGVAAYLYEKSFRDIFILIMIVTACFGMTVFSFFSPSSLGRFTMITGDICCALPLFF